MRRGTKPVASVLGAFALLVGCNAVLGIEEQPTRAPDDAATEAEAGRVSLEHCAHDSDCVAPNGCYTPHCDTVLGACTYALCEAKDRTCAAGVCDVKTFACSDPQPYGFLATRYDVPGITSGCGPNPRACVAASFPFLFLGTRDDVVALRTDDLAAKAAITVPIVDLTVRPQQMVASGRRLWVIGAVQGVAPPYQLAIAVLDVPSDPTVTMLHAHTSVVSYPFPTVQAFAAPNGGLFITYADAALGFPTARLGGLPTEGAQVSASDAGPNGDAAAAITMVGAAGVPAGSAVIAASGARLVLFRGPSTFNLITMPGTPTARTQPDQPLMPVLNPIGPTSFAQGPDGEVMMAAPINADPAGSCNCTTNARLQWIFPSAIATATDVNVVVDPAGYANPQVPAGVCHQCSGDYFRPEVLATWVDRRSVLTAAPSFGAGGRTLTDVRYIGRDPLEANGKRLFTTKATDKPKGDFASDRIALTSANGFGYFVVADDQGNDASVSIVDPRCDAR